MNDKCLMYIGVERYVWLLDQSAHQHSEVELKVIQAWGRCEWAMGKFRARTHC